MPLPYVASGSYGPILLDELIVADNVPAGSPAAVPGADGMPGSVTINQAGDTAIVNNFPQRFQNKTYRVVVVDLTAANLLFPILFQGTIVWAVWGDSGAATPDTLNADASAYAFLRVNDQSADPIPISPGFQMSGFPYNVLYISAPAQATKKLYLFLSSDQPVDRLDSGN